VWKLLDFGVSKLASRGGTLTAGHVIGTPGYMAPEQARGEDVDHRADGYALAAIAYRCLTGHPAFTGKDVPTTLYDVVYKMPTRPRCSRPSWAPTSIACSRSGSPRIAISGSARRPSWPRRWRRRSTIGSTASCAPAPTR
jgi:serine/threonine protein kinase